MTEPKRLLDARGAPNDVTRLLRAARRDRPPPGLRRATWQSMAAKSAAASIVVGASSAVAGHGTALAATTISGASAATGAHAIASKGLLLLAIKSVAAGAGIGICALSTHHVIHERMTRETSISIPAVQSRPIRDMPMQLPTNVPAESVESLQLETHDPEVPAPVAEPPRKPAGIPAFGASPKSNFGEQAQLEAQRVAQVRQLLRAGDGRAAIQSLAALERETSLNLLGQEREALKIDALIMLGQRAQAHRLEERFRARYPNSPLLERWATK